MLQHAAQVLADVVHAVDEIRPPRIEETYDLFASLVLPGTAERLRTALRMHGTDKASPLVEEAIRLCSEYEDERRQTNKPIDPVERDVRWRTFNQTITAFMSNYDVMLCPVNAFPAMKHGTTWDQLRTFSYTMTFNLTGHPAAVVRCGTSPEGLPIGVQVVGQQFREDVVFSAAKYLEDKLGGWRPPPV